MVSKLIHVLLHMCKYSHATSILSSWAALLTLVHSKRPKLSDLKRSDLDLWLGQSNMPLPIQLRTRSPSTWPPITSPPLLHRPLVSQLLNHLYDYWSTSRISEIFYSTSFESKIIPHYYRTFWRIPKISRLANLASIWSSAWGSPSKSQTLLSHLLIHLSWSPRPEERFAPIKSSLQLLAIWSTFYLQDLLIASILPTDNPMTLWNSLSILT